MLIAMSGGFVTALISLTGDLSTYWPLYLVPIVIASLAYHVGGAVIASALATALVALLMPGATSSLDALPQLVVGMGVFLLSGLVIGAQAHRQRQHSDMLEQASIRDSLTGLYKGDYLQTRLDEEMRRSDRYSVSIAFILVAVNDHEEFKRRFGHYKADLMLEHTADLIRISVRDTDIVARYGPTEFAVILPFSSTEQAYVVSGRIERSIAEAEFEGDVIEPQASIDVAVGVAAYPGDANDDVELLHLARQRLTTRESSKSKREQAGLGSLQEMPS